MEWVSECATAPTCTFPSPRLWMIVNKVGIHRRWMSTVISAPPPTCGFPIFSQPTSVIVITSGQAGAGVFVWDVGVNHWVDGGRGPKLSVSWNPYL